MTSTSTNETTEKSIPITAVPGNADFDYPGAGLVLNLDASKVDSIAKSANGTTITTWTDLKSSLVATSQANTATYDLNGIKLDGTDYFSIPATAALNLTTAMSIFVVATVEDVDVNTVGGFVSHSSGASGYQFRYTTTPNGDARFNLAGVVDMNAGVTSWQSGIRASIGVVYQGGAGHEYQKNGSQLGSSKAGANGNSANVPTLIGAAEGASQKLIGKLHQILVYNTKLAGDNLTSVGEDLFAKWRT